MIDTQHANVDAAVHELSGVITDR